MYTKLVPETVHYIKFHTKIYLKSFVSINPVLFVIYNLFTIIIWNHLQKYFLQLNHHIKLPVHQ